MIEAMKHCNMDAEAALNHLLQKGTYYLLSYSGYSSGF